jgi:hypothetical protein
MPQPSTTRNAIKRLLREFGPMSVAEIAAELGKKAKTVSSCISTSRDTKEKHFYIVDYEPQVGRSGLPAGIYAEGNRKDAKPPETDRAATSHRYYENHKARIKLRRGKKEITPFTSLISQITR